MKFQKSTTPFCRKKIQTIHAIDQTITVLLYLKLHKFHDGWSEFDTHKLD